MCLKRYFTRLDSNLSGVVPSVWFWNFLFSETGNWYEDKHPVCPIWAKSGYCQTNSDINWKCPHSCNYQKYGRTPRATQQYPYPIKALHPYQYQPGQWPIPNLSTYPYPYPPPSTVPYRPIYPYPYLNPTRTPVPPTTTPQSKQVSQKKKILFINALKTLPSYNIFFMFLLFEFPGGVMSCVVDNSKAKNRKKGKQKQRQPHNK